nr:immunoglobulin light chain junction region [Macaca mulatta]
CQQNSDWPQYSC